MARNNGGAVRVSFRLLNPTLRDIGETLGVSESTVNRRVREHGISVRDGKCNMTDVGLDEVLRQVKTEFPKAGFHTVLSQLL